MRLLSLQWSVFFDDFVLGCMALEGKHIDLIQSGFFATLGWETSGDPGGGPFRNPSTRSCPAKEQCLENLRPLLFAENQVFGRSVNRAFREISSACRPSGFVSLTAPLAAALEVLRDRIILGDPRCISVAERQNFHLYTDACFEQNQGGAGGMLYGKGGLLLRWFSEWHDNVAEINEDNKKGLIFNLSLQLC